MKKDKKYSMKLEINFLGVLIKKINKSRQEHDAARDRISQSIVTVMNGDWGDNNMCMQRGGLMAQLKAGESLLNRSYLNLLDSENDITNRVGYLTEQINICKNKEK